MVILGFMLNYALRVNITLAIVAMVRSNTTHVTVPIGNLTELTGNLTTIAPMPANNDDGLFDWDKGQIGIILGSFYWGYLLTELPGGRLAEMIGGRRVFGHSMLWASIITALTPFLAHMHYYVFILGRVFLGLMLGKNIFISK